MENIDSACPLCQELYDETQIPKIIPDCGHTFCASCIEGILINLADDEHFVCPVDKQYMSVCLQASKELSCFPTNLKQISKRISHINDNQQDNKYQSNSNSKHQYTPNSNSNLSPYKESEQCKEHNKKYEYICVDHKCRICTHCAIFGQHKGHDIKTEDEIIKEITLRTECLIDLYSLIEQNQHSLQNQNFINQLQLQSNETQHQLLTQINNKFSEIYNYLQEQQNVMLKQIEQDFIQINHQVQHLVNTPQQIETSINLWKKEAQNKLDIFTFKSETQEIAFEILEDKNITNSQDIFTQGELIINQIEQNREKPLQLHKELLNNMISQINESYMCQINNIFQQIKNNIPEFNNEQQNKPLQINSSNEQSNDVDNIENIYSTDIHKKNLQFDKKVEEYLLNISGFNLDDINDLTDLKIKTVKNQYLQQCQSTDLIQINNPIQKQGFQEECNKENVFAKNKLIFEQRQSRISQRNISPKSTFNHHKKSIERFSKNEYYSNNLQRSRDISKDHQITPQKKSPDSFKDSFYMFLDKSFDVSKLIKKKHTFKIQDKYKPILESLKEYTIDTADFTNAEVGDLGIAYVCDFIPENKTLKSLKIVKNKITDDGFYLLVRALYSNTQLQTLNLTQNLLTDKSLDLLFNLLQINKTLKIVYLNQNQINTRVAKSRLKEFKQFSVTLNL